MILGQLRIGARQAKNAPLMMIMIMMAQKQNGGAGERDEDSQRMIPPIHRQ